jgi:hypothetical protein
VIVKLALDAADGGELVVERSALLHHALCALLIVPKVGVLGKPVQLVETPARVIDVKDASSAVRPTA